MTASAPSTSFASASNGAQRHGSSPDGWWRLMTTTSLFGWKCSLRIVPSCPVPPGMTILAAVVDLNMFKYKMEPWPRVVKVIFERVQKCLVTEVTHALLIDEFTDR